MHETATKIVRKLVACSKTLVTAESCTAGLVSAAIAAVPGASKVLWGGFITYTAESKAGMLGVDEAIIRRYGAVSKETTDAMALGALINSIADISVSITGLAGPGGDGSATPVGTVWIGVAVREEKAVSLVKRADFYFEGSRNEVRLRATEAALWEINAF
jgi:PncC family amidohydrolase